MAFPFSVGPDVDPPSIVTPGGAQSAGTEPARQVLAWPRNTPSKSSHSHLDDPTTVLLGDTHYQQQDGRRIWQLLSPTEEFFRTDRVATQMILAICAEESAL